MRSSCSSSSFHFINSSVISGGKTLVVVMADGCTLPNELLVEICSHLSNNDILHKPCLYPYIPLNEVPSIFRKACRIGNLNFLKYISFHNVERETILVGFEWAVNEGHLHVLHWLKSCYDIQRPMLERGKRKVIRYAVQGRHVHVLQWLIHTFEITTADIYDDINHHKYHAAAVYGDLPLVQVLFLHFPSDVSIIWLMKMASRHGHLEVLRFLLTSTEVQLNDNDNDFIFVEAAENGHVHVLQWLKQIYHPQFTAMQQRLTFHQAIVRGHLPALKWLVEELGWDITCHHFPNSYPSKEISQWLDEQFLNRRVRKC